MDVELIKNMLELHHADMLRELQRMNGHLERLNGKVAEHEKSITQIRTVGTVLHGIFITALGYVWGKG